MKERAGCDILIGGQSRLTLPYGVEGKGGCVACLWQVVNGFNSLTDKLGK